jgi:hypothetical protein
VVGNSIFESEGFNPAKTNQQLLEEYGGMYDEREQSMHKAI